jgi:uncharacterized membrane protein (UPF0182 family)
LEHKPQWKSLQVSCHGQGVKLRKRHDTSDIAVYLFYMILYHIILYYIVIYCIVLYYISYYILYYIYTDHYIPLYML